MDILAVNDLCLALDDGVLTREELPFNLARFLFLDPFAKAFFLDWGTVARDMVGSLRTQAGRDPVDRGLSDLIGELTTRSNGFATRWARHDVRLHRTARKRLGNRVVGEIELTGDALDLAGDGLTLIAYSAAPGSHAEDQLKLLAAWSAPRSAPPRPRRARVAAAGPRIRELTSSRSLTAESAFRAKITPTITAPTTCRVVRRCCVGRRVPDRGVGLAGQSLGHGEEGAVTVVGVDLIMGGRCLLDRHRFGHPDRQSADPGRGGEVGGRLQSGLIGEVVAAHQPDAHVVEQHGQNGKSAARPGWRMRRSCARSSAASRRRKSWPAAPGRPGGVAAPLYAQPDPAAGRGRPRRSGTG